MALLLMTIYGKRCLHDIFSETGQSVELKLHTDCVNLQLKYGKEFKDLNI